MTRQVLTLVEAYEMLSKTLVGKTIGNLAKAAAGHIRSAASATMDAVANMRYQASLRGTFSPITTMVSKILALASAHKVATAAALGVVGAIVGLAVYMYKTGTSFEDLKNKAVGLFESISSKLPEIMSTVAEVFSGIVQQIPTIVSSLVSGLMSSLSNLAEPIIQAVSGIVQQLPSVL